MSDLSQVNTPQWAAVIKRLIRSEMTLHGVTYQELSRRLRIQFGTVQTVSNLKTKINKGVLGAQLFVQILTVLGTQSLDISQASRVFQEIKQGK